jgi:hypothetical protein
MQDNVSSSEHTTLKGRMISAKRIETHMSGSGRSLISGIIPVFVGEIRENHVKPQSE